MVIYPSDTSMVRKDKDIDFLLKWETKRQQTELEMIASENHVSPAVMHAIGNVFTNKYSEGYPGIRYYGWQEYVDKLESLCQYRALKMMDIVSPTLKPKLSKLKVSDTAYTEKMQHLLADNAWGVNVQALSGSPANAAVFLWLLKPWDTILGMDLSAGGHLTHGHKLSISGLLYNIASYGVTKKDYQIDYREVEEKALKHKPKIIIAWFSAYPRTIDRKKFKDIAKKVEKKHKYTPILMADIAHIAWLVAGKQLEGPRQYFDVVTTTTHKTLRGPRWGLIYYRNDARWLGKVINRGVFPGIQWGPHVNSYAAKAIAFEEAMQPSFKKYAAKVIENTKHLAAELHDRWWNVISWGTENHLLLLDTTQAFRWTEQTWLGGKHAEKLLESIGISVNKNMIPFDTRSPLDPSGLRIGTAALTTRGMWKKEMTKIATIIELALLTHTDKKMQKALSVEVKKMAQAFPLPYK